MDHQGLKSPGIYCVPGKHGKEYVGQMGRGHYEAPLASKRSLPWQSILQVWGIIYFDSSNRLDKATTYVVCIVQETTEL
jgi:hypothetical protein